MQILDIPERAENDEPKASKGFGNVFARKRRPGLGRQQGAAQGSSGADAGCVRMMIALQHFVLGVQPVFGFVARFEASALRQ